MNKSSKILVTGASGMVGSSLVELMKQSAFENLLTPSRKELDLLDRQSVDGYFHANQPEYVFMIAARVGGIGANMSFPMEFLSENVTMQINLFEACFTHKTRKNLFMGSSCIYPRECPQPIREEYLLTGPLEPTNEGYALAKIAGIKLAEYYFRQYGMLTVCPMACNIYGTHDHFDLEKSHVLSALVKRFVDARNAGAAEVTLWGTGSAYREFIHSDDAARALLFLMEHRDGPETINVGTGKEISIRDLASLIAEKAGYRGATGWDPSKPDGMPRKCLDVSKLLDMGFRPQVELESGIERTIREYESLTR